MARLEKVRDVLRPRLAPENSPNDTSSPIQRDNCILETKFSFALVIRLNVSQVSHMAIVVAGGTVSLPEGIKMRSSSSASVCQVTPLTWINILKLMS